MMDVARDLYDQLTGWLFEIERHGEARSSRTTYSVLPDRQIDAEFRAKLDRAELHDLESLVGDGPRSGVAPSASEASMCALGTWRNTSRLMAEMVGRIMIARTMPALRIERV